MASSQLLEYQIKAGETLLNKLAADNTDITAAFWLFKASPDDSPGYWQLVLASPDKDAYNKIWQSLKSLNFELSPLDVHVVEANHPLIQLIGSSVNTGKSSTGRIRFSNNGIIGQLIDDALIYRLAKV